MAAAMGPYGWTGASDFVADINIGFVKAGASSYNGFPYDYGYLSFYLGYPYYYWYTSGSYSAFSYANYDDVSLTDFFAINGYYGVSFTP